MCFISTPVRPALCLIGLVDTKYYSSLLLMSSFFVYTATPSRTRVSHWSWIALVNPWSFDWIQKRVWQKRKTQSHATKRYASVLVMLSWCCQFPLIGRIAAPFSAARQPTLPGRKRCNKPHPMWHSPAGILWLYISLGLHQRSWYLLEGSQILLVG